MEYSAIQERMRTLCRTKNWRKLIGFIDDGYKGIYVVLRIVQEGGENVVAGDIARAMNVSTARIAKALNTLENKNYIRRISHTDDGRKVVIQLTEQGERALEERYEKIAEMLNPMLNNLNEEESEALFSLLIKLLR